MNLIPRGRAVMARVYGEYLEMPGLQVTLKQAQHLFGLGESECAVILEGLVERQLLERLPNGKYTRSAVETRSRRTAA